MTITTTATDGLLKTIGWLHPEYGVLINFLIAHEAQLTAAGPVIVAAATEGPAALAAAEKAAPGLTEAIKHFIEASPAASYRPQIVQMHSENITRRIVGAPILTPDQENEFLSQDSRSGSG
jgi:hypothetical protein